MDALALTDHGGMYGVVEFYSACKDAGIKPILGCEIYVAPEGRKDRRAADKNPSHLTVLAQNNTGYHNLIQLVTKANLEGFYYKPRIDKELLEQHADGLIVLSGCPSAELPRLLMDGNMAQAEELARWYKGTFPSFYLELQRHENLPFLNPLNDGLLALGAKLDIPIVATNDLHYVNRDDARYQDVMVCIQTNTNINDDKRLKMSDDSYYLRSPQEMADLFPDLPEAVQNTQRIAEACDVSLDFSTMHLPEYRLSADEDADGYLRMLCWQGFGERYGAEPSPEAKERLEYELDVISKTQYPNYFLVVWDIADFARRNDIVFGVRGSAASSIALYCLGVTEIDPLEYRLVFERFLNIERKEMPDIDMDFQDDRRDEAIHYVVGKYGEDHVAQIITFGTLGAKAAIRDVGRALAMPLADVDQVARLVPTRVGMTIDGALEATPELREAYDGDETLRNLIDTAKRLEGVVRHASTHAAGVVISREPLADHVPLQRATKGGEHDTAMTQFTMEPLAKLGLLKMDFLGLINYTILSKTQEMLKERHGLDLRLHELPFDDAKTFALLASGETTAIFQLESPGMRRHIKDLRPSSLAELAAMVALFRPGPMEHIATYIGGKHGKAPKYPHPALQEILEETYGVIVYQDQVLHILRTFAGYSLGEADIVRKAMGKKIADLMAQERERFLTGAEKQGYERELAGEIFDLIEPFAGYAFNKAHSVSYAVVAYWTAYFKANHPAEFMTCVLNAYVGNADKTAAAIAECVRLGIHVLPPEVNRSETAFSIDDADGQGDAARPQGSGTEASTDAAIRFGLASIKNIGEGAVADLVAERRAHGPFSSLGDFGRRAGAGAANRRVLESLIRVGALDDMGGRGSLLAGVDSLLRMIQRESALKGSGQSTMFDLFGQSVPAPLDDLQLPDVPEPTATERAAWERELLGAGLGGQNLAALLKNAPAGAILSCQDLEAEAEGAKVLLVGQVASVRLTYNKEQQRMAFPELTLQSGSVPVGVNSRVYPGTEHLWQEGSFVTVHGRVARGRNDELMVWCDAVEAYELPAEVDDPPGADGTPDAPPVEGPRMEEWPAPQIASGGQVPAGEPPEPVPAPLADAAGEEPAAGERAPVPGPEVPAPASLPTPPGTVASTSGEGALTLSSPPVAEPASSLNGHAPSAPETADAGPRKLLVNLTETHQPQEDAQLLRRVLQVLLDYPGADAVDLIIVSQGKRWRMEMPIIRTHYCQELVEALVTMLGRQDAITLQAVAAPAGA